MIRTEYMREIGEKAGFSLSGEVLSQLDSYARLLVEWNGKMNLTAITEPDGIAVRHFLDSLLLLSAAKPKEGAAFIDVGTGAGFPGIPCKLVRQDLRLTLLDSLQKRIGFLEAALSALGIEASCVHARAEEAGRTPAFRESFDLASARAVARLRELCEYCLPFVRVGGLFAAMKGGDCGEELSETESAVQLLGGSVEDVKKYLLPDGSKRAIILIRKISQTPTKYPRPFAKMKKHPLA